MSDTICIGIRVGFEYILAQSHMLGNFVQYTHGLLPLRLYHGGLCQVPYGRGTDCLCEHDHKTCYSTTEIEYPYAGIKREYMSV